MPPPYVDHRHVDNRPKVQVVTSLRSRGAFRGRSSRLRRSLTSGVGQIERAGSPVRGRRAPAASATAVTSAVIVATAIAEGGGAAAAQRFQGEPVLRRMLGQLASVGVPELLVLTRPERAAELAAAGEGTGARLETGASAADDLRAIEAHARATT